MSSVDVVIPCYNYGRYLRQCMESVLQQEGVDIRVLIIDDCSPDNTPEIGQQLAAEDARVEYRRHPQNKGHIATYNEGLLEWAKADYCVLLSADDYLTPGALRRAAAILDEHPEVVLVHGKAIVIQPDGSVAAEMKLTIDGEFQIGTGRDFLERCCHLGENIVETPTAIVRTSIQHRVGGYRSDLPHAGDMEMWMRLALQGDVAFLTAHQAYYRRHANNMSNSFPFRGVADLTQRYQVIESIFQKDSRDSTDMSALRYVALKNLARQSLTGAYLAFESGDGKTSRDYHRLARRIDPEIVSDDWWKRMEWKCLVGCRVWSVLSAIASPFRSRQAGM